MFVWNFGGFVSLQVALALKSSSPIAAISTTWCTCGPWATWGSSSSWWVWLCIKHKQTPGAARESFPKTQLQPLNGVKELALVLPHLHIISCFPLWCSACRSGTVRTRIPSEEPWSTAMWSSILSGRNGKQSNFPLVFLLLSVIGLHQVL